MWNQRKKSDRNSFAFQKLMSFGTTLGIEHSLAFRVAMEMISLQQLVMSDERAQYFPSGFYCHFPLVYELWSATSIIEGFQLQINRFICIAIICLEIK